MSGVIEPEEIGLGSCACCDHEFQHGERYHRGIARGRAGVLLYLLCERCAQRMLRDTVALAGMPAEGRA